MQNDKIKKYFLFFCYNIYLKNSTLLKIYFRTNEEKNKPKLIVDNYQKNIEKMDLDGMAEMLKNFAVTENLKNYTNQNLLSSQKQQQQLQRKLSGSSRGSIEKLSGRLSNTSVNNNNNPFETINQEKLEPSRIELIQHMFEKSGTSNNNNSSIFN